MGLRSTMLRWLNGVPVEEHEAEHAALRDSLERARWRVTREAERRRDHEQAVADRLRSGSPVACPECGSTDLTELVRYPDKVQVRCPSDHRSTWTGEGIMFVHYQEMLARTVGKKEKK